VFSLKLDWAINAMDHIDRAVKGGIKAAAQGTGRQISKKINTDKNHGGYKQYILNYILSLGVVHS